MADQAREETEVVFLNDVEGAGIAQPTVFLAPPPPLTATVPIEPYPMFSATVPIEPSQTSSTTVPLVPSQTSSATVPLLPLLPLVPISTSSSASATAPIFHTQPVSTMPLPARRLLSGRRLGVAALVLVVLVAGGLTAYHFLGATSLPGPEAAVDSYFRDLASGDAKDAAALATGPYAGTPVVGPQTLADAAKRPSGLTIVSSRKVSATEAAQYRGAGIDGSDLTVVSVRYTVHGTVQNDTFLAEQDSTTSKWKLVDPYREMAVSGGWSSTITVDGESADESGQLEVFPGGHLVADPSSRDFAADGITAYPSDVADSGGYAQTGFGEVALPAPVLSAAGQAAAQAAYRSALDACAAQAATGYADCGLSNTYDYYTCNSVTWTITSVAEVRVDLGDGATDGGFAMAASGSTAAESGDYTDFFGIDQTFQNQSTDLEDSSGTIVFNSDGSATVTLTE